MIRRRSRLEDRNKRGIIDLTKEKTHFILVYLILNDSNDKYQEINISETISLIENIGGEVKKTFTQKRDRPDPRFAVGKGKIEEIRGFIEEEGEHTVLFDMALSPSQARIIEEALKCPIMDRNELIMEIFSRNARTEIAKAQVELAYLEYLKPRLKQMWGHFSRIAGRGKGAVKGPGEKQIEMDRREIGKRITLLKEELKKRSMQRDVQRSLRKGIFNITLVGYTNAGKSTLLNQLTSSRVLTEDRVFVTLDPTIRRFYIQDKNLKITFTDTVGFIRGLPHQLIHSFHSTLLEIIEADLLIHVIDGSALDYLLQRDVVLETLKTLEADKVPLIEVINKADLIKESPDSYPDDMLLISARNNTGIDSLWKEIVSRI